MQRRKIAGDRLSRDISAEPQARIAARTRSRWSMWLNRYR
jgi:hypothetical protein